MDAGVSTIMNTDRVRRPAANAKATMLCYSSLAWPQVSSAASTWIVQWIGCNVPWGARRKPALVRWMWWRFPSESWSIGRATLGTGIPSRKAPTAVTVWLASTQATKASPCGLLHINHACAAGMPAGQALAGAAIATAFTNPKIAQAAPLTRRIGFLPSMSLQVDGWWQPITAHNCQKL